MSCQRLAMPEEPPRGGRDSRVARRHYCPSHPVAGAQWPMGTAEQDKLVPTPWLPSPWPC